jgi:hypothetical protein
MKAKLIKQGNEYFLRSLIKDIPSSINVYHKINETEGEFGFGEHSGKLSKQNCDEIFGVVDVEKLAEKEYPNGIDGTDRSSEIYRRIYIEGFNKAIELNKDKLFTVEDIEKAYGAGMQFIGEDKGSYGEFIQSLQPTEIEVEIEMEPEYIRMGGVKGVKGSSTKLSNPAYGCKKTDENGCLILKKI